MTCHEAGAVDRVPHLKEAGIDQRQISFSLREGEGSLLEESQGPAKRQKVVGDVVQFESAPNAMA